MEIQFPGPAEIILSSTSSFVECFSLEPTRNILNLPTQISKEPLLFCGTRHTLIYTTFLTKDLPKVTKGR